VSGSWTTATASALQRREPDTDLALGALGAIRAMHEVLQNLVHGSDSSESAEREIGVWFPSL